MQGIVKTPGSSGLYIISFEAWTIFARAVHSYTSGFWIFFQEHDTHSITKAKGLAIKHNSPAEYCRPQTKSF